MTLKLVAIAMLMVAASGPLSLLLPGCRNLGQRLAALMVVLGSLTGLYALGRWWWLPAEMSAVMPWPAGHNPLIGIDALSAFFLVPILVVGALGAVFGLNYWAQRDKGGAALRLQVFWGSLLAGMMLLVISRQALAFLLGWEIMALSAFFLISADDRPAECRRSGLIYLIATHFSTLVLFGMFGLWRQATGSFALTPLAAGTVAPVKVQLIFFLSFIGFGLKAGIMPLHFWLPGAHANAPSHVSAVLSGVMLKMGVYGLIRMLMLLPGSPPLWGWLVLLAGGVSGLLGVVFALAQHDLKRLLAYHSVENIGIILLGLGLALLGRSYGRPEWVGLGLAGCLLHVWNHSLFKSLLFFGAGSILHRTHSRQLDRLGGLARFMPGTAIFFLVGAVAICGLPPLNGFVSEFFIYLGVFRGQTAGTVSLALLTAPVLAMIGALAVACFVKVYGAVFLGLPRYPSPAQPREVPLSMLLPMAILAFACLTIGLFPRLMSAILDPILALWLPDFRLGSQVPFFELSCFGLGLLVIFGLAAAAALGPGRPAPTRGPTWDCGYARPEVRMQYTASSFARSLVGLFAWVLKPETHGRVGSRPWPPAVGRHGHVDDLVLDRILRPAFDRLRERCRWFYRFQQGQTHFYVLYLIVVVMIMMATLVPFKDLVLDFF